MVELEAEQEEIEAGRAEVPPEISQGSASKEPMGEKP
jgi:hypothetical protein